MIRMVLAATACFGALVLSHGVAAAGVVPEGKCAFTVASRHTLTEVKSYIQQRLDASHGPYLRVARTQNGWYAITVGDVLIEDFRSIKARFVSAGVAPEDSFCSKGESYVEVVPSQAYATLMPVNEEEAKQPVRTSVANPTPARSIASTKIYSPSELETLLSACKDFGNLSVQLMRLRQLEGVSPEMIFSTADQVLGGIQISNALFENMFRGMVTKAIATPVDENEAFHSANAALFGMKMNNFCLDNLSY